MSAKEKRALSPLDLFVDGGWSRALFGTYTLSLAFFESYVEWVLRSQGCERLDVLVDVRGYRASLVERQAVGPGQSYELVSVNIHDGIFHPKFVYLWGEGGGPDALLVGSGNLTFGGYGRNIEVFEFLDEIGSPRAFEDFADFLAALLARDGVQLSTNEPVKDSLARLQAKAQSRPRNVGSLQPRLLHSIRRPVLDQLLPLVQRCAPVEELVVWSPYHHQTAEPVKRMVAALRPKRVLIGVPPGKSTTTFPHDRVNLGRCTVEAIKPTVESSQKTLHAKWYEIRGARTMAMSGSVNATLESLCSTTNIELAVFRELAAPTSELWRAAKFPTVVPSEFAFSAGVSADAGLVHARLTRRGALVGQVWGIADVGGTWRYRIECGAEMIEQGEMLVGDDAHFEFHIHWRPVRSDASAAQLTLYQGPRHAYGWLAVDEILELDLASRNALGALDRLLTGEDRLSDVRALFDAVLEGLEAPHTSSGSTGTPGPSSRAPRDVREKSQDNDPELDTRILSMRAAIAGSSVWHALGAVSSVGALLDLLLDKMVGPATPRAVASEETVEADDEEEDTTDAEEAVAAARRYAESVSEALARFNAQFERLWEEDARIPAERRPQALLACGITNLFVLRLHPPGPAGPRFFLERWLRRATSEFSPPPKHSQFVSFVAGGIAMLAAAPVAVEDIPVEHRVNASELRELAERFFGPNASAEDLYKLGSAWLKTSLAEALGASIAKARESLETLMATPTVTGRLAHVLAARATGLFEGAAVEPAVDQVAEVLQLSPEERALLREILRAAAKRPVHRVLESPCPVGCPKCYCALSVDTQRLLSRRHLARCPGCTTPLMLL